MSKSVQPFTALTAAIQRIVSEQASDELRGAACGEGEAKVLSERILLQLVTETLAPGASARKWVVAVTLTRRDEARVAHSLSLYAASADGDGSVTCHWASDMVQAIVTVTGLATVTESTQQTAAMSG